VSRTGTNPLAPHATVGAQAAQMPATDRWEKDIAAFEAKDKQAPPPQGAIVFVAMLTAVE